MDAKSNLLPFVTAFLVLESWCTSLMLFFWLWLNDFSSFHVPVYNFTSTWPVFTNPNSFSSGSLFPEGVTGVCICQQVSPYENNNSKVWNATQSCKKCSSCLCSYLHVAYHWNLLVPWGFVTFGESKYSLKTGETQGTKAHRGWKRSLAESAEIWWSACCWWQQG